MWPWEHILFAYVFYSLYVNLWRRESPDDWPVVALAFGSVLPDIVDKPLAWQFDLVSTGYGIAHSVFVVIPVFLFVYALRKRDGVGPVGAAFGFGYLLHLVGDVLPRSLSRGYLYLRPVLWPVWTHQPANDHGSLVEGVRLLLSEYVLGLIALEMTPVRALQIGSIVLGATLWLYDGRPGLRFVSEPLRRGISGLLPG
jgi:hypothetical protein